MIRAKIASIIRARITQRAYFKTFGIDFLLLTLLFLLLFFVLEMLTKV
jgi:hypothetical protein